MPLKGVVTEPSYLMLTTETSPNEVGDAADAIQVLLGVWSQLNK